MSLDFLWYGPNGTPYEYRVYGLNTNWNDVPGNYIFVTREDHIGWVPLYIGETGSFQYRLDANHEKWAEALHLGMTHIHAHTGSPVYEYRRQEEWNLIRNYNPPLNKRT